MILDRIKNNKEIKNASWIVGGRVAQMVLSLLVGLLTARYLGPSNYGLINYSAAYVSFFSSLCNLGINSIIIKNFSDHPDEQGYTLGTTFILRLLSSILSSAMIVGIVALMDNGEDLTIQVTVLVSLQLVFHIFDSTNYWFQSRYQSKVPAIASLLAYIIVSVYKIVLLILQMDVKWFAFATSLDYICAGIFLLVAYKKEGGPKLKFSIAKAKELLGSSYHYILSGMMVAIYGQTDKLMLKQMLGETEVGYYSVATTICTMWVFVLQAIIDSVYPTIIRLHKEHKDLYERKNRQLYCMVFYISVGVSFGFLILGDFVVRILYGAEYMPAVNPLKIITWYTAFSYLGVARNAWIVCEGKQKYLKYMYAGAAVINIVLNFALIPMLGTCGAALASLITQIATSILLPMAWKDMRRNSILILEGICFKNTFNQGKTD